MAVVEPEARGRDEDGPVRGVCCVREVEEGKEREDEEAREPHLGVNKETEQSVLNLCIREFLGLSPYLLSFIPAKMLIFSMKH